MRTSLKPTDDMMMSQAIRASDAANMFRRKVSSNERPLEAAVLKRNNVLVDKWYETVLVNIADSNGALPALRINKAFEYFFEGFETKQYQKYKDRLPRYTEENVRFWIDFFLNNDISVIHEAGISVVSGGWATITGALRNHFAQKRWDVVYSLTDEPLEWDKLANDNPHLMHARPMPFDLTEDNMIDMEQKVRAVLGNTIQPRAN